MEPLIKESTVRLAEKISVLAKKGETVEVLGWVSLCCDVHIVNIQ